MNRRESRQVLVGNIAIGGTKDNAAPVVVQSMTNTDTADIDKTVRQIIELADSGSEMVRVTVNNEESAIAVPEIVNKLSDRGYDTPIVGDFHYNGHTLLTKYPECAKSLAKYRINPGNVGFGKKKDNQFQTMIEAAIHYNKPIRIGVNWGSLDQALLASLMDQNSEAGNPLSNDQIQENALIMSALNSAKTAEEIGLSADKIIISCKVSKVNSLISVYRNLASQCEYPLHLGLTEAGMGVKGIVGSTAALSVLLSEGIGDTIRVSLTPEPNASRTKEVIVAQEILQSLEIRSFTPQVTSCPGCGRTTSVFFQELAAEIESYLRDSMKEWREKYSGVEEMDVAVMGCIVNGPGESKHANIGISLPGTGEDPSAPVFVDGKKVKTLKGKTIANDFKEIVENYVKENYGG